MAIRYRAVHTQNPWRAVNMHKTLDAAIEGKDGAKSLLLRAGRIKEKWTQYGDVLGVFVWEDGASSGSVFRLKPGMEKVVQQATVPLADLIRFDCAKACSLQDIGRYFF